VSYSLNVRRPDPIPAILQDRSLACPRYEDRMTPPDPLPLPSPPRPYRILRYVKYRGVRPSERRQVTWTPSYGWASSGCLAQRSSSMAGKSQKGLDCLPKKSVYGAKLTRVEGACPGPETKQPDVPDGPAVASSRLSSTLASLILFTFYPRSPSSSSLLSFRTTRRGRPDR